MKYIYFIFASTIMMSCHREPSTESFPILEVTSNEWATYEGNILTDEEGLLRVEISLKEGPVGMESYYELCGQKWDENMNYGYTWKGKYIVTSDGANRSYGIQLMNIRTGIKGYSFFQRYDPEKVKFPEHPEFTEMDLFFITSGDGRLVLTDENFHPISDDDRYTIRKRSNLFTVEGYVTVHSDNDKSEFFERNTQVNWRVHRLESMGRSRMNIQPLLLNRMRESTYVRSLIQLTILLVQIMLQNALC